MDGPLNFAQDRRTSSFPVPAYDGLKVSTLMLIRLAYDIQFDLPSEIAMVALLNVHPSRVHDLLEPDELQTEPKLDVSS
jgi:hypothetical protein